MSRVVPSEQDPPMRPVVTPEEMRAVDAAAAVGGIPVEVLVERAGAAVAQL